MYPLKCECEWLRHFCKVIIINVVVNLVAVVKLVHSVFSELITLISERFCQSLCWYLMYLCYDLCGAVRPPLGCLFNRKKQILRIKVNMILKMDGFYISGYKAVQKLLSVQKKNKCRIYWLQLVLFLGTSVTCVTIHIHSINVMSCS